MEFETPENNGGLKLLKIVEIWNSEIMRVKIVISKIIKNRQ